MWSFRQRAHSGVGWGAGLGYHRTGRADCYNWERWVHSAHGHEIFHVRIFLLC